MKKPQLFRLLTTLSIFLTLTSCVKGIDLEQGEEFILLQSNTVNLVSFNIGNEAFDASSVFGVVRDTTRLEFLAEPVVQENLNSASFTFEYNNTYAQSFDSRIVFLSEENEEKYIIEFEVAASPDGSPRETLFEEPIPTSELDSLRQSIKVLFELRRNDNGQPVNGNIRLRSKVDFILELGGPSTGN